MRVTVLEAPSGEPITLEEAKAQLRVDHNDEDDLISSLIKAACQYCEQFHGQAYIKRRLRLTQDGFPSSTEELLLPWPPVSEIEQIAYDDQDDQEQVLDSAVYQLDISTHPARLRLAPGQSWPATSLRMACVRIDYVAGYGEEETDVPEYVRQAVRLRVADLFEHREPSITGTISSEIQSVAVEALLWPTRVFEGANT